MSEPQGTVRRAAPGEARRRRTNGRARRQQAWRLGLLYGAVALVIVAIVAILILDQKSSGTPSIASVATPQASAISTAFAPVAEQAAVVREVTTINPAVIAAVGTGGLSTPLKALTTAPLTVNGKPELLYVGAEYCPYCAVERWSLINALARFGTFSNLSFSRSAADDGNIATFTFVGSQYTSSYLGFVPVELADRAGNTLQTATSQQAQLVDTYTNGGIPFVDVAGRYWGASGFEPTVLSGLDWPAIAGALTNAHSPTTKAIVGNANYLTAAICIATHDQPGSVCKAPAIHAMEGKLS
jgi:hypothetical protein